MQISCGIIVLNKKKQELEKIQIEAARISTGATKLVSLQKLYKKSAGKHQKLEDGNIN